MAGWIKKATSKHKGAFKAAAAKAGKTTRQYAAAVKAHPERYSPTTRRRAALAKTLMAMHGGR